MDILQTMLDLQREFQEKLNGYSVAEQTDEQRITNFKISMFALIGELYEAVNELGWKEWATSRHINRNACVKELIDGWHFFMNLLLHMGVDSDELLHKYTDKLVVNLERQRQGYDGSVDKCAMCGREMNEANIKEVVNKHRFVGQTMVDLHCVCGAYLGSRAV